jgi:hypothetical protein
MEAAAVLGQGFVWVPPDHDNGFDPRDGLPASRAPPYPHFMRTRLAMIAVALATITSAGCGEDPTPRYDVTVNFNEAYTDSGGTDVSAILHEYDSSAEILLQEIFPPILRTTLASRRTDLCDEVLLRIGSRPDVRSLDCQPAMSR